MQWSRMTSTRHPRQPERLPGEEEQVKETRADALFPLEWAGNYGNIRMPWDDGERRVDLGWAK